MVFNLNRWLINIPLGMALALNLVLDLALNLAIAPSSARALGAAALTKQSNPPPPPTNPGSSAPGGRRNASACPQDADLAPSSAATPSPGLTALSPTTLPGLTSLAQPTFLVYVPATRVEQAEFSLRDPAGHGLYRTTIDLPPTPAIVSISLPAQSVDLEVGTSYIWTFAVICNPGDRLEDQFVTATVQRIALDSALDRQFAQASGRDRLALYQQQGLWYDALSVLLGLRRSSPQDASLTTLWDELLRSGGIDPPSDRNSTPY